MSRTAYISRDDAEAVVRATRDNYRRTASDCTATAHEVQQARDLFEASLAILNRRQGEQTR